jgi:dTDP-glucose 4,6-dehydratase
MEELHRAARIFITGGTGFFGRALLRYLCHQSESGHPTPEITLLSRAPQVFLNAYPEFGALNWLQIVQGDVQDLESMNGLGAFSHVLHAATDSTRGPQMSPLDRYDQIVHGTRSALEFALRSGATRFLLTSSGGVYGPQPPGMELIPEDWNGMPDPLDPRQAYSLGKRGAEHLTALYHDAHGLETVVARCFAFVGEDLPLDVHFAMGNFLYDALYNEVIRVKGNGHPMRSYMDQEDLAHWLWVMLDLGLPNRAYNVGSDAPISLLDLAYRIRDLLAPQKDVVIEGQSETNPLRNLYVPSIERARDELGLGLRFDLNQGIQRAVKKRMMAM